MIQRIQTVYLFVAFIFIGLLFFIPFASLISNVVYSFSLAGVTSLNSEEVIQQPYWLTALGAATALLVFIIIFLYKNRKLQMKLTVISILLSLALNAAMYYLTDSSSTQLTAQVRYTAAFIFPVISSILLILAYRGIRKDENLIKSLDRIR